MGASYHWRAIIAAVGLARDDTSRPSPRLTSAIGDSVQLAKQIMERFFFVREGKTRKSTRHVPLSDRVRDALRLRAKMSKTEWVFASKRQDTKTGHITHTGIEKPFRIARETAKLPKELVLYSARHSFVRISWIAPAILDW